MKEFRVKITLRNNRLVQRREELGMSQVEFSRALGATQGAVCALETMRSAPMSGAGVWGPLALRIAAFHGVPPEELWPEAVLSVRKSTATLFASSAEMAALMSPEDSLAARERMELASQAFNKLSSREQLILTEYAEGSTWKDIGAKLGICGETARKTLDKFVQVVDAEEGQ